MAQQTRSDLHAQIEQDFPDNTTEEITPADVRDFLHKLVDSATLPASDGSGGYSDAQAKAAALASLLAGNEQNQGVAVSSVNGIPKLSVSGTEVLSIVHFQAQNIAGNAYSDLELFAPYKLDVVDGKYNLANWEAQVLGPDGLALSAVVNTQANLNSALATAFASNSAFVIVRHRLLRAATTDSAQARFTYILA